jgi:hypothetical protein
MSTQEEIIEMADKADEEADKVLNMKGEYHPNWHQVRDEIFAKLVADKKEAEMQERIDKLHNMYELVCQHRDMLMAQQDAMIAALRGKMQ